MTFEEAFLNLLKNLQDPEAWEDLLIASGGATEMEIIRKHLPKLVYFDFDDGNKVLYVDRWQKWINAHPEEMAKYPQGTRLAVHDELGIVASAPTLSEVVNEVRTKGYSKDHILFTVAYGDGT